MLLALRASIIPYIISFNGNLLELALWHNMVNFFWCVLFIYFLLFLVWNYNLGHLELYKWCLQRKKTKYQDTQVRCLAEIIHSQGCWQGQGWEPGVRGWVAPHRLLADSQLHPPQDPESRQTRSTDPASRGRTPGSPGPRCTSGRRRRQQLPRL